MSDHLYARWRDHPHLPLECLVNTVLLYRDLRDVVQHDLTYYDAPRAKAAIRALLRECDEDLRSHADASGNIVVYRRAHAQRIEAALRAISDDGSVEGAFRTPAFADLLDADFYAACQHHSSLEAVLSRPDAMRVSVDVMREGTKVGCVLVQMCRRDAVRPHLDALYRRFLEISEQIHEIDASLHTSLTFYVKSGPTWRSTPELAVRSVKVLP